MQYNSDRGGSFPNQNKVKDEPLTFSANSIVQTFWETISGTTKEVVALYLPIAYLALVGFSKGE